MHLKDRSKEKQLKLHKMCERFVHRVDAEYLRDGLPPFRDTLLYLNTSVIQSQIMRKYDRGCKERLIQGGTNFFKYDFYTINLFASINEMFLTSPLAQEVPSHCSGS